VKHIPVRGEDTYTGLSVDVRDFGARGDGVTDDTEAIRAAVKAAFERRRVPQHPQYGYFVSFAEVYFPSGHYIISDTMDISYIKLRGENYAAIEQVDPEKDLFYAHDAWRQLIEGLTFLGGRVQLNLGNPNVDTGHVTVRDCHFKNSRDAAVQMRKGSNSTFFKVENCVFWDCGQSVINHCDMAVVRDCWMSTSASMQNKAVMENYGVMHVDNLLGVPRVSRGPEKWVDPRGTAREISNQRWIDNYSVVHIRNSRFGGEGGGFPAVCNLAPYRLDDCPSIVTIESSYLYNAQDAAVVLKEVPNKLSVVNCSGLSWPSWIVRADPGMDLDTYFDRDGRPVPAGLFSIDIRNTGSRLSIGLPEQLAPYQLGEITGTGPPQKGNWSRGQFIRNLNAEGYYANDGEFVKAAVPALEQPWGWLCTESGKPGKWEAIPVPRIQGNAAESHETGKNILGIEPYPYGMKVTSPLIPGGFIRWMVPEAYTYGEQVREFSAQDSYRQSEDGRWIFESALEAGSVFRMTLSPGENYVDAEILIDNSKGEKTIPATAYGICCDFVNSEAFYGKDAVERAFIEVDGKLVPLTSTDRSESLGQEMPVYSVKGVEYPENWAQIVKNGYGWGLSNTLADNGFICIASKDGKWVLGTFFEPVRRLSFNTKGDRVHGCIHSDGRLPEVPAGEKAVCRGRICLMPGPPEVLWQEYRKPGPRGADAKTGQ